jgi:hypothetical protein
MNNLFRTDGWVKSTQGPAVPGAQVFVCTQPANIAFFPPSPLAPIYSDPGGLIPLAQPVITDGFGHYDFYTVAGLYTVVVANGGLIQQVYPDQSVGGIGTGGTGSTLTLENNGVANGSQTLLNLYSSDGSVVVTDDGIGDINLQAKSTSFSGSGAYFYGPGITDLGLIAGTAALQGGENINSVGGQVQVYLFELLVSFTISKATQLALGSQFDVHAYSGIYSYAGNKLVDAGTFTYEAGLGLQTNTFTAVTLPPGTYWHAHATDTTSVGQWVGVSITANADNALSLFSKNATRAATAANTIVSGGLPATLGALTPFTPSETPRGDFILTPLYE